MSSDEKLFTAFPPVSREEWESVIEEDLRGADYKEKLRWQPGEGITALPFYRREDLDEQLLPVSTRGNRWEVRQPIGCCDTGEANRIARNALQNGADALSFRLEVQRTEGELGGDLRGVALQDGQAFDELVHNIDLSSVPLHFDAGPASPLILAMLHNAAEQQSLDPAEVSGSLLYDPYAFIATNGALPKPAPQLKKEIHQLAAFCAASMPQVKPLGVDARIYHNAGATIVQELGYALAAGSEFLATLSEEGMDPDSAASAIHFNFAAGSRYFLEIAKFRAARLLWRAILDEYGVAGEGDAYIHGSSSTWNKTVYDPYVNMLRTTTEGMSAAIAGCDAVTLQPFDEPLGEPDDFSRRIARNTQSILKEESYFHKVADPSAGSYYIEILTDKIGRAAWDCFREVERQGGILESIRGGYLQAAIEEAREQRDRAIATRKRTFVGTNQYPNSEEESPRQAERKSSSVVSLKETETDFELDPARLMATLKNALQQGAALGDLVPAIVDLQKHDLRPLRPYRGAQAFEALRRATENHSHTPEVMTLPLGDKKMRKARSAFSVNLFGCVGYHITDPIGFESIGEAVKEVGDTQPEVVVLCSSDEEYRRLVPELCKQLDEAALDPVVVLAGKPGEAAEEYRAAGVDMFIHARSNLLETLREFQQRLGIL